MKMLRFLPVFTVTCGAVLSLAAQDARAQPPRHAPVAMPSDFDLAHHGHDESQASRFRIGEAAPSYPKEQLGPHWSSGGGSGPTVEVGALGAGRKGAPRLAHIGVYSSF